MSALNALNQARKVASNADRLSRQPAVDPALKKLAAEVAQLAKAVEALAMEAQRQS